MRDKALIIEDRRFVGRTRRDSTCGGQRDRMDGQPLERGIVLAARRFIEGVEG
jgi:hypothetical protein